MRQKLISLGKDTVLWEAGDVARDIAVVTRGKLGIRTEKGIVGIALPLMVLGENAVFDVDGCAQSRSASVVALEDDTQVTAYPAAEIRETLEAGDGALARQVLDTLVGQICRNLLMVISARQGDPLVEAPLLGLVRGIVGDLGRSPRLDTWNNFIAVFSFLHELRDLSDHALQLLGPEVRQQIDLVENASQILTQFVEGRDVSALIEIFLTAEREKAMWWARGAS
ncbi:MAG: cyclic nucleotide-binding domain-containing protein [Vicinamibacteria bacterium]|nr:cyclic nucleotide-binding domain-containing protein [Vicinamibacteria bacterium]